MEHPVPQNITTFEFHLVGDMTLKQFVYLASGLVIAYLAFVLLLPVNLLVAAPIILISSLVGAAFAFLPILDRPLDHWVKAFFRAVYSPTEGFWQSPLSGKNPEESFLKNRLEVYLSTLGFTPPPQPPVIPKQKLPLVWTKPPSQLRRFDLTKIGSTAPSNQMTPTQQPITFGQALNQLTELDKQIQSLQVQINEVLTQLNQLKEFTSRISPAKYEQTSINLQNLVSRAESLERQKTTLSQVVAFPKTKVMVIEPLKSVPTQMLLTSMPNVINGVVSDPAGMSLEGVIVIIHDKNNLPVRALKTNKLGQFTGATPLPAGTYTITLEKEGLSFDTLQITLMDEVIPPLKIKTRKGEAQ